MLIKRISASITIAESIAITEVTIFIFIRCVSFFLSENIIAIIATIMPSIESPVNPRTRARTETSIDGGGENGSGSENPGTGNGDNTGTGGESGNGSN